MKYQVKYGKFIRHTVSCESKEQVKYCQQQLSARGIASEVIDVSKLTLKEKTQLTRSDFSFQRFKKEILK